MNTQNYAEIADEVLLANRNGENDADAITDYLCDKYKNLVRKKANALYLIGAEKEDLIQEGMIGLFKAIRDFDATKEVSFYHFAKLCISRQMYHAIEASQRLKHAPLNSYVSFFEETGKEGGITLEDVLEADTDQDPEKLLILRESYRDFYDGLEQRLSPMEKQVCELYLQGKNYHQIADILGKSSKSIDNALQRIRKKISEQRKKVEL
ncbi:MAG: sigma-70 family RNA polymerase sigma factor [Lachnospiraceae bacterium]|nr:sigma-70 family RNA polymerase sigma factor [Lachnospiraceae bacterium]